MWTPLDPLDPWLPQDPLLPDEPLLPEEPLEPLLPQDPLLPEDPRLPLDPLLPLEPLLPWLPQEPLDPLDPLLPRDLPRLNRPPYVSSICSVSTENAKPNSSARLAKECFEFRREKIMFFSISSNFMFKTQSKNLFVRNQPPFILVH